jgi:hypothetical protein
VKQILEEFQPDQVCHGACIGADNEFHELALHFGVPLIEVWPSNIIKLRALLKEPGVGDRSIVVMKEPQPPLDRNWDIVREADLVVACPDTAVENLRSGTWATVRYADQLEKTIKVVKPYDDDTQ